MKFEIPKKTKKNLLNALSYAKTYIKDASGETLEFWQEMIDNIIKELEKLHQLSK